MVPMGCGMDGYMELNPDWNGSREAMAAAAALDVTEAGPGDSMDPGVGVPPFRLPMPPCPLLPPSVAAPPAPLLPPPPPAPTGS